MTATVDAFWRAAAYCLHPRVMLWSLLPLLLAGAAAAALGWAFWDRSVIALQALLEGWAPGVMLMDAMSSIGLESTRTLLAPVVVVALALLVSLPLWLVPPVVLVLPPLIWGWLTYRVFAFDVLAAHATPAERRQILRDQHWPLLAMGVVCGYLGAAPSLLWAASAATLVLATLLVVASVWLYTLVFALAACWFTHFALAALQRLCAAAAPSPPVIEALASP